MEWPAHPPLVGGGGVSLSLIVARMSLASSLDKPSPKKTFHPYWSSFSLRGFVTRDLLSRASLCGCYLEVSPLSALMFSQYFGVFFSV